MSDAATADCGHPIGQDFEWPGDDGTLCYPCWEAACDQEWWEMVTGPNPRPAVTP